MKILKKAGWLVLTAVPAVVCYAMQYACAYGVLYFYYFQLKSERPEEPGGFLMQLAAVKYSAHAMYGVLLYHVIAVVVFGVFYYFMWGRKKRPEGIEKPKWHHFPAIIIMGILLQILISGILSLIYLWKPEWLSRYLQLMQAAGIGGTDILVIVTTVILAPVGEEILCRGIMLRLAEKVSDRFWIANILQALAFGMIHGNLVQGIYAFVLGLVLGYIYGKYRRIWINMLLHAVINFSSIYVDEIYGMLPDSTTALGFAGVLAVVLILLGGCFFWIGKIHKPYCSSTGEESQ